MNATQHRREAHRIAYERLQQALEVGPAEWDSLPEADRLAIEKHLDKLTQYHFNLWKGRT